MKKLNRLTLLLICLSYGVHSQTVMSDIFFKLNFDQKKLLLETSYHWDKVDSLKIETLQFYVSDIQLWKNDQMVKSLSQKHFLIDASNPVSQKISYASDDQLDFNRIKFNIGIDSLTSVSGAFGGDLDPTNGMYWTWQSGYINFKLEGISNQCPTRKNRFQFHLGGYQAPFYMLQEVMLPVKDQQPIIIQVALDEWLTQIDLRETNEIMSPNKIALALSKKLISSFTIQQNEFSIKK